MGCATFVFSCAKYKSGCTELVTDLFISPIIATEFLGILLTNKISTQKEKLGCHFRINI